MDDCIKLIAQHRTRFIILSVSILLTFFVPNLSAQNIFKGVIKGKVVDDSTNAPLPGANVFVASSTIGTASGNDGKFQITNVPYGIHQIVASFIGYTPLIETIDMTDTTEKEIVFRLKPKNFQLSPVVVEGNEPEEWKNNLKKFITQFFGKTPNAEQCKLLNPEVLDFSFDEETSAFTATVREPLIIENKALGYRLYYYLKYFKETDKRFQYYGVTKFEQLESDSPEEIKQWKINRQNTYYGSRRHFFYSLFHKSAEEEGFKVKWIRRELGLSAGFRYGTEINPYLGNEVDPNTLLTDGKTIYEKKLSYKNILQATYGENTLNKRISRIELVQDSITVYSNGEIAEQLGILTFGYWSTQRAAEFLPWEYKPQ